MSTYKKIASTITNSNTGAVTFSSIPSTYRDLLVRVLSRSAADAMTETLWYQNNGDTSSNYVTKRTVLSGNTSTLSADNALGAQWYANSLANSSSQQGNSFAAWDIYISEYANTNFQRSGLGLSVMNVNNSSSTSEFNGYLFRSTSATSSITIKFNGPNFVGGSSFYLYGI